MYKTSGIVLKRTDIRNAARLYTAYTEDCGKVLLLARGAGKIKSKMAGHMEPLSLTRLAIAPGKNASHLAGAVMDRNFRKIFASEEKSAVALRIADILDQLTRPGQPDPEVFRLLSGFMERLERVEGKQGLRFLVSAFIIRLFSLLGYAPELHRCVACKCKVQPENISFDVVKGGLICPSCRQNRGMAGRPVSIGAVKIMRLLSGQQPFGRKIRIGSRLSAEVFRLSLDTLQYYLDQPVDLEL